MQETQVRSLGRKDLLEKEMTTLTPVFLSGKSYEQRGPQAVGHSLWSGRESDKTEHTLLLFFFFLKTLFYCLVKGEKQPMVGFWDWRIFLRLLS